jgi:tetratricopeptide (TPR) repeat protein
LPNSNNHLLSKGLRKSQAAVDAGQLDQAKAPLKSLLQQFPGHPEILHQMGLIARLENRIELALQLLQQAANSDPGNPVFLYNLGNTLLFAGHLPQAEQVFEQALLADPGLQQAATFQAVALARQGKLEAAKTALLKVCGQHPKAIEPLFNLALVMISAHDPEPAIARLEYLLELDQNHVGGWHHLGLARFSLGQLEAAEHAYRRALKLAPGHAASYRQLAIIKRYQDPDDPDLVTIRQLLKQPGLAELDRMHLHFALAKMLDETEQYDQAFEQAQQGNALHHSRCFMDQQAHRQLVTRQIKRYDQNYFAAHNRDHAEQRPLFIVGMPRSGTTLLEQMLASHPEVGSAGEVSWMKRFARQHSEAVLDASELDPARQDYLAELGRKQPPRARYWIDKMPSNFLYLGLIASLFPQARVIHIQRDPLDTCRSNFFTFFADSNFFSNRLDDLALYFQLYQQLMGHWRQVRPLAIKEISYEALVTDTEKSMRSIVEFLDLPWHDRCLSPLNSGHTVMTASAAQVRQAVNTRGIGRAAAYEKHFQLVTKALDATRAD